MPVFTRRRLQSMLNDLGVYLENCKVQDLISRLENKRPEQALPAEMEIALLWGLAQLGDVEPEPEWFGTGRLPDAYSECLFPARSAIVEIAAMLDIGLSGESDMRRASHRLCEAANKIKRKSGQHLFFHFGQESGYEQEKYFRRRKVEQNFTVTDELFNALAAWIRRPSHRDGERLHLDDGRTDVIVEWRERKPGHFNFFCSMPSEVHSITENPLYTLLAEKSDQMKSPDFGGVRCLLLADAGSTLLRRLEHSDLGNRTVSGQSIILNFLSSSKIDVVCVFSPYRPLGRVFGSSWPKTGLIWRVTPFFRPGVTLPLEGIEQLAAALPKPRFEGYQAKALHQQAAFSHTSNRWYLATNIHNTSTTMTISISALALLDLLAERITPEQFIAKTMNGHQNQFKYYLDQGHAISGIRVEPAGLNEDDDRVVVEFSRDPAVTPLIALKRVESAPGD